MRIWTAHLHPARPPVLVQEGWSWGAAAFGPFWLLAHRAWVPGVLVLAAVVILNLAVPGALRPVLVLGFFVLLGLLGRDLLRWALDRRGYALQHVVAAPDGDAALLRLLDARADLVPGLAGGAVRASVPVPVPETVPEAVRASASGSRPSPTSMTGATTVQTAGQMLGQARNQARNPVPNQILGQAPGETPSEVPSEVPSEAPDQIPSQVPNQTPRQAPGATPGPAAVPPAAPLGPQ